MPTTRSGKPGQSSSDGRASAAFTIIELLISMAVIFILITTAFVALRYGKKAASRTESMGALRQIMVAYTTYSGENNQRLLPGYIDPADIGPGSGQLDIKAELRSGYKLTPGDTAPYVWRLAPYLDHEWKVFMADYRSTQLEERFAGEHGGGTGAAGEAYGPDTADPTLTPPELGIAKLPSFGLNSIFVGGDNLHGDPALSPWSSLPSPNPDSIAATRFAQVKYPAKLIAFAPTKAVGQPASVVNSTSVTLGYVELRPPFANFNSTAQTSSVPQWTIDTSAGPTHGQAMPNALFPAPGGVPIDRVGDDKLPRIPLGHLDGSVDNEYLDRLSVDMSRWSPFALSTQ